MKGHRKIERQTESSWEEIKFSDLKKDDFFKITDLDEDGTTSKNGLNGAKYKANSNAKPSDDGLWGVEAEYIE